MSTDRELLELAAKAAGMHVLIEGTPWPRENIGWFFNQVGDQPPALHDRASRDLRAWAPLTDDGDALRLAVKLHLTVEIGDDVCVMSEDYDSRTGNYCAAEGMGDDPCAAARRAIVRAAAEIGKAMP
jgi:hypothetical protein